MPSKSKEVLVYGNMEWFEVEQPSSFDDLPKAFKQASDLWKKDKDGNFDKYVKLLTPYVTAKFLPINITNWEEIFDDPSGEGFLEFDALSLKIVGVDFSDDLFIPTCKAEAIFKVQVTSQFSKIKDLDEWQSDNDFSMVA